MNKIILLCLSLQTTFFINGSEKKLPTLKQLPLSMIVRTAAAQKLIEDIVREYSNSKTKLEKMHNQQKLNSPRTPDYPGTPTGNPPKD